MSVVEVLIGVIAMQLATTIMGVTPALATLDTQAMDFLAQVSATRLLFFLTVRHQVMTATAHPPLLAVYSFVAGAWE